MVAGRHEIIPLFGAEIHDEQCISVDQALKQDRYDGLLNIAIPLIHADRDNGGVNIRIAHQPATLISTGCTGDKSSMQIDRTIPMLCPEDIAQRCGKCVLNTAAGVQIQNEIEKSRSPKLSTWIN